MASSMSASHSFKNTTRARIKKVVFEDLPKGKWYVLVADTGAVKVLSSHIRQSELLDYNISCVDPLEKSRKEHPDAVYLISPITSSINALINDMQAARPVYDNVYIYFTSKLPEKLLTMIKSCTPLLDRLRALKEVHTEVSSVDSRTFHTNQPAALARCFGAIQPQPWNTEVHIAALRLATVFTTLRSQPSSITVRTPTDGSDLPDSNYRSAVCKTIGEKVRDNLISWRTKDPSLFTGPACDLIILDRGSDPVAPLIHPFHYASAVHDLVPLLDDEVFMLEQQTAKGVMTSEVALNEKEALWNELRHCHLGEAANVASERVTAFSKSKGAIFERGGEASKKGGVLAGAATGLPEYLATKASLALHTRLIEDLFDQLDKRDLQEVGKLEQGVVFGELKSKDLITGTQVWNSGRATGQPSDADKMRLLLCFLATHPGKLDAASSDQWKNILHLSAQQMQTISNIGLLGVELKKPKKSALSFVRRSTTKATKYKNTNESFLENDRFRPLLMETIDRLVARKLARQPDFTEIPMATNEFDAALAPEPDTNSNARSVRSTSRHQPTWHKATGAGGASVGDIKLGARVVVVFVVGGFTWSEVQAAHELSVQHGVEVILGGTNIIHSGEDFLQQLAALGSGPGHVALEMEGARPSR